MGEEVLGGCFGRVSFTKMLVKTYGVGLGDLVYARQFPNTVDKVGRIQQWSNPPVRLDAVEKIHRSSLMKLLVKVCE